MVKQNNINQNIVCVCGHTHITEVGDLGPNNDEIGLYRLTECTKCDCENFIKQ